jgi:selenocysteine-specific translation elongation factor
MHYVVSVPLDKELADFLGKGDTEGSIVFHARKIDGNVIVGLAPSSIEEKFYAAAETLLISNQIVLSTAIIDKMLGEILIACSLLDKHTILTTENKIDNLLANIKLPSHEFSTREELIPKILSYKQKETGGTRIDIDHAFPVKGVGSVVLGIVTKGKVKVHDELYHSSGKLVTVRSIQSQDVDIQEGEQGTRVGLALKGIEHDEIEKGDLLTKQKVVKTDRIISKLTVGQISREELKIGGKYLFVLNFSYTNVTVVEINEDKVVLKLERSIAVEKGDRFLLLREKMPRIFACGEAL